MPKRKVMYRECEDLKRGPNGNLIRIDAKDMSRRRAHRLGFLNKSPQKRATFIPDET